MKPVLILTASFGEGHNAAARNIRTALGILRPDCRVVVADPFQDAYGPFNEAAKKLYLSSINHTPRLWGLVFRLLDETPVVEWHMGVYFAARKRLSRLLETLQPGVVVSTYPGCNHLLDPLAKTRLKRPFRIFTVVTDSLTVNSAWHRAISDAYLLPNEETAHVLRERNLPEYKLHVPGFPVPPVFAEIDRTARTLPGEGGAWKVLYVVNCGEHLAERICRAVLEIPNVQLTVPVGKKPGLEARLRELGAHFPGRMQVLGWVENMPELMAANHVIICKAGGATVQECLAAGLPMLLTQIVPGQEEGNGRLVLESGAGLFAGTPDAVTNSLLQAFSVNGALWQSMEIAAKKMGNPDGALRTARFIIENSP